MLKDLKKHLTQAPKVLSLLAVLTSLPGFTGLAQAGDLYRQTQYKSTYKNCSRSQDNCTYYQVDYPILATSTPAAEAINKQIYSQVFGKISPEQTAAKFFTDFANDQANGASFAWALQRQVRVESYSDRLLSLRDSAYEFRGGAHGNYNTQFHNFDLQTGKALKLSDIFRPGYEKPLTALAEQIFREQRGIPAGQSLAAANFSFPKNRFQLSQTILITPMGLHVYYNPYEIASFAQGSTEIEVPFYQIEDWLKEADQPHSLINQLRRL